MANEVNTAGADYSVGNYGIFEDAITTTNGIIDLIDKKREVLLNKKKSASDEEFFGPVAESVYSEIEALAQYLLLLRSKYENIVTSLQTFSVNYEEADKAASEVIESN